MDFWHFIGFIASILSAATFIPEVIKAFKTQHLRDVSWGMLFLVISSSALWLIFGIRFYITPLILSSSMNVILASILIILKVTFHEKSKVLKAPLGIKKINNNNTV